MTTDLDAIIQRISAGDTEGVERALVSLLRDNPQNADAWMLLATLYDDPSRKADCYRQVLHINPSNRRASIQLQALTNLPSKLPFQGKSSTERDQAMRCPQCGGAMEVQYIGEMRDKRAVCEYCNTEVDLPDSYQRVKKKRTQEQNLIGKRTVEETVVETRRDGQISTEDSETLPPEIQKLMRTLKEKGPEALDDELLRKLQAHGINVSFDSESFDSDPLQSLKANGYIINEAAPLEYPSTAVHIRTGKRIKGFLRRLFSKTGGVRQKPGSISPMDITKLAGGALSPEERRQCPNPKCQAVIPKDAKKCTWCGELL